METMLTGKDALQWAVSLLVPLGYENQTAWMEASLLLGKAWNKNKIKLVTTLGDHLDAGTWDRYRSLVARRVDQEPLQYILGEQEFMSLCFKVTPDVLIPRGETELLVAEALRLAHFFKRPRILDLCTGSGAIAVSLAYYLPACRVWAADVSSKALEVARDNAQRNGVDDRIEFFCGDLFSPLPGGATFDIITGNPPYVSALEYKSLSTQVKKEPRLALYGGIDGLEFYRAIGEQAPGFLPAGGYLLLEIGWKQGAAVKSILEKNAFCDVRVIKDWNEHDRIVLGRKQ